MRVCKIVENISTVFQSYSKPVEMFFVGLSHLSYIHAGDRMTVVGAVDKRVGAVGSVSCDVR